MTITFRRATSADAEALVAVQIAAFHSDAVLYPGVEEGGPPGYESVAVMLDRIQTADYFAIELDGRIVGGIGVFNHNPHFHLDVIYVDPAYHSRGIGSAAMEFLDRNYPSATLWTLDTPVYATRNHHFYEKFGYERVREFDVDGFGLYAYERNR